MGAIGALPSRSRAKQVKHSGSWTVQYVGERERKYKFSFSKAFVTADTKVKFSGGSVLEFFCFILSPVLMRSLVLTNEKNHTYF